MFRGHRLATLIRRTSESWIIDAFRGGERVASLIERTNKSVIIEESRGSAGSDFDQAHEGELAYSMVQVWFANDSRLAGPDRTILSSAKPPKGFHFLSEHQLNNCYFGPSKRGAFPGGCRAMVWVVILIQRTSESLIIEEFRGFKGRRF